MRHKLITPTKTSQVHVRHGDKWREAKQVPAPVYFERAQALQVLLQQWHSA